MNRAEPLGVAVLGAGRMGADHVRRIAEVIGGARVAAVADVDAARAEAVAAGVAGCAAYPDPVAAMDDPGVDAVLIASPGPAHEAALLAALERRLPVLCEKPLTPDAAAALRIVHAEAALGRRLIQVGFMRRYDADFQRLKALLAGGEQGRTLLLRCTHRNASTLPGFTDAMLVNDSVVHEIDTARWLLGQEITAVTVHRPRPSGRAPRGLGDPQLLVFETDAGVLVDVEIFVSCGFGYQVRCEAVNEGGTARVGDDGHLFLNAAGRWGGVIPGEFTERFADAYDREVRAWVAAVRAGRAEGPSAWDGYAAAAVCEAALRAQREGGRVTVESAGRPALYEGA
ncbi:MULTISPECIES: Gfo/Idh/MocA family protein [Streptomycetaceae]|uniref:Inositol 2-dehydrogenase n=1 Tax=Streptantibioticus cattleyicolor (strain ATCC 35852 / DSM 46488 / JCM 4925 / NBRC 14057 / NRRL 8057) TaxID=1003195 RepID=F8JXQ7_STREN|nr:MULTISPECIES: Gfo/Idh/MocA family oxidoreductase [Streptomycetaceae]AEW97160.1 myo-inositol 2-dehydrogenase [Streptantibioticus cattleyicolor NRRL 8057 = DSM 46488]MYS61617.1 Gfo/Idh/MocA family oxidoreductase [Streptomyces sp. SID5468]CCB77483.1 Inositol 2-dehydrogenase [Streptantibioticus cattleyicolor NRRL 8057 = DSM 46488]